MTKLERMIETDQRRGFRESVSLDHSKPESAPELLVIIIKSGAAADDRPKLPPESGVNAAKSPPAPAKMLAGCFFQLCAQRGLSNPRA